MRLLLGLLATGLSFGQSYNTYNGLNYQFSAQTGATFAPCLSFYAVDFFTNFNSALPGAAVSTANLASSTEGISATWTQYSAQETFVGSRGILPAAVPIVGGTTHGCGYGTQSIAYDGSVATTKSSMTIPGSYTRLVLSGAIILQPGNQGASGNFFDDVIISTQSGHSWTVQYNSGTGASCGAQGVEIEASGGSTVHSSCNSSITSGVLYYYSFDGNASSSGACTDYVHGSIAAPCAQINFYSLTCNALFNGCVIGPQVGSTIAIGQPAGTGIIGSYSFGSNEAATYTGSTYFQWFMGSYTSPTFPNLAH